LKTHDIRLLVDPAVEMLEVLRSVKEGSSWEERALGLLGRKSYRYVMFTIDLSRKDLMEILESLLNRGNHLAQRLRWLHKELSGYLNRLDDISTFLGRLETTGNEIASRAREKAEKYLPKSAKIEADIYLVIGGSDGYGVNLLDTRAVVMNAGLFISQLEEMIAMMAHELHHKAENRSREIYWRFHRTGPKNLERVYDIVSELIGEGIAALVTFPYGFAHKYALIKENNNIEYKKVEDGIQESHQDITDKRGKEIFASLYSHGGPLYMVGCDMAKKIEDAFGREKLIVSAQEPLSFFQAYRRVVDGVDEGYKFKSNTIGIIQELQEKINHM